MYIVDVIIRINLVHVLFGPAIPTSSYNFQFFFILVTVLFFITLRVIHVYFHQCHLTSLVPSPF